MKERRTIPGKLPARQVPGWCLFIWVPTSDASCCEPGRNPTTHRCIPSTLLLISLLCLLLPLASTGRRCGEGRTGSRKEWGERAVEPTHLPTHKGRRRGADATLSSETGPWKTCYFVQSLSCVRLFVTPWTAACFTISQSLLKLTSIESVMPSNYLILCHPLLLLPSIFPRIRVFSSESVLHIRWPKFGASASVLPMNIQDWFPLGLTGLTFLQSKGLVWSQESSPTPQFKSINSSVLHKTNGHC